MLSCHTWLWFNLTAALTLSCTEAQPDQISSVFLCVSLTPCLVHHSFKYFSLLSKLSFILPVLLSLLELSLFFGLVLGAVFVARGGLIPQECGIKPRPRLECCSQATRAWLDVGVCAGAVWMSPDLPRARWCLLFSPFWHIFVPFLFPPCMNQQAQELRFPPAACFPKFPSFLPGWAAELRSPSVCMGLGWCHWGSHCH